MRIATFPYLRTGWNIHKPLVKTDVIHIGPCGGQHRFDAHGRKFFLKSA